MSLGLPYKQLDKTANHYDAIVIGSGMSGLATAAILSKQGWRVLVLEQHYTAGGATHTFKRPGFEWDVGLHYIGQVHIEDSEASRLLHHITDGNLQWESMGSVYDIAFHGDKQYNFVAGIENFRNQMLEYFPKEKKAIDHYLKLLQKVVKANRLFFASKILPLPLTGNIGKLMRRSLIKFGKKTTLEVLREITNNKELIAVLTSQYGDYGLPPSQSSFAIHATVAFHYLDGAAYPVGGSSAIAKSIIPVIENNGGKVVVKADVSQIVIENGKAIGVEVNHTDKFYAKKIISAAGIHNTNNLLSSQNQQKFDLQIATKNIGTSAGHYCLYVGLEGTQAELNLTKSNYWVYPDGYDHDSSIENYQKIDDEFPFVYISFPSVKDPSWKNNFPGKHTIEILTMAKHEWFTQWESGKWRNRGEEYEKIKSKIASRLLEKLYEKEPQLRGKVTFQELSTPLSSEHFCRMPKGGLYGLLVTPDRYLNEKLNVRTSIKNLLLSGQDIICPGVMGALIGGYLTSTAVLNRNAFGLAKNL